VLEVISYLVIYLFIEMSRWKQV